MKKMLALGLSLLLTLTLLAACGGDTSASPSSSASSSSSEPVASEPTGLKPATSKAKPSSVPEAPVSELADDGEVPVRGAWDGTVYTNDFTGITFTAPEDWLVLSDEDLAKAVGIGTEGMTVRGEEMSPEMLAQSTIYDACVASVVTGTNIIFALENLTANHPMGTMITPEAYFTATKALIEENYPDAYTFGEPYPLTVGGQEYLLMEIIPPESGQTQLFMVRKVNNYMILNTITLLGGDSADDIIAMFS